jgi:hypothetical protein
VLLPDREAHAPDPHLGPTTHFEKRSDRSRRHLTVGPDDNSLCVRAFLVRVPARGEPFGERTEVQQIAVERQRSVAVSSMTARPSASRSGSAYAHTGSSSAATCLDCAAAATPKLATHPQRRTSLRIGPSISDRLVR